MAEWESTPEIEARIKQALIYKATRLYLLGQAPFGASGEMTEFGSVPIRPDYAIRELLFGLRFKNWDIDLAALANQDDVIRYGLETDPDEFPDDKLPDVEMALLSARSWVATEILEPVGF